MFPAAHADVLGRSLIAGRPAVGDDSGVFQAFWPLANRLHTKQFFDAAPGDVTRACTHAADAFAASGGDQEISAMLLTVATDLVAGEPELLAAAGRETGLSRVRLGREFARMVGTLKIFSDIARSGSWRELLHSPPSAGAGAGTFNADLVRTNIALGPVAVFTASNFPFAYGVCGGDFASAIACGCPVVVKGHPAHPATGEMLAGIVARVVARFGLHPGMFSFLHAGGLRERAVGWELLLHPAIRGAGFTGSIAGGEALRNLIASERAHDPIPLFAENGSCNMVVVCAAAARSRGLTIAGELARSILDSSGQQCTKPGIIAVESGGGAAEVASASKIATGIAEFFATTAGRPMLSPRITEGYAARVNETLAVQAQLVHPLRDAIRPTLAATTPHLLSASMSQMLAEPTLFDEIFGPAAVFTTGRADQLKSLVRASRGMLAGAILADAEDAASVSALLPELAARCGRVVLNGVTTGVRVAPAMVHGGPHPATSAPESTAVGPMAARRWTRPICLQHMPGDPLSALLLKLAGPRQP